MSTPTTATLDHTAYPHLIDRIFTHAPRASLLVLRQVSRAWRRRADGQLAHHLIFRLGHGPLEIVAPHGRLPLAARCQFHFDYATRTWAGATHASYAAWLAWGDWTPDTTARFFAAFRGTRVVEVTYALYSNTWGEERFDGSQLDVVKFLRPGSFFPQGRLLGSQAQTVIGFTEVAPESTPFPGAQARLQPRTRRLVLNVDVGTSLLSERAVVACIPAVYATPSLRHAVIILHQSGYNPAAPRLRPLQLIAAAFDVGLARPMRYTLVGAERVSRARLGFTHRLPDDLLAPAILAAVKDYARAKTHTMPRGDMGDAQFAHACEAVVDRLVGAVEVLTHDEYLARVGAEQYLFETTAVPSDRRRA